MYKTAVVSRYEKYKSKVKLNAKSVGLMFVSFLLGRAIMFQIVSPISFAYISIFLGSEINIYLVSASTILGALTVAGKADVSQYIVCVLILNAVNILFNIKNMKMNIGKAALITGAAIIISHLSIALVKGVNIYIVLGTLFICICAYLLCFVFAKINLRSLPAYVDEISGAALIFAAAIAGTSGISLLGFSFNNYLAFAVVILAGYIYGASFGATAGVMMGLLLMVTQDKSPYFLVAFSTAGICCGFFKEIGKSAALISFVVCSLGVIFYFNKLDVDREFLISLGAVAITFFIIPSKILTADRKRISFVKNVSSDEYIERIKDTVFHKLLGASGAFEKLSVTLDKLSVKPDSKSEVAELIDEVASKACRDCGMSKKCWEQNFYSTYQAVFSILSACEKKGKTTSDDIPSSFYSSCVNLQRFVEIVNRTYEIYKNDLKWNSNVNEIRSLIGQQLLGVSGIMQNLCQELEIDFKFNMELEGKILDELNTLEVENVIVLENKYGKYFVNVNYKSRSRNKDNVSLVINNAVNKVLGRKLVPVYTNSETEYRYAEEKKFKATCGAAASHKSRVSGDSYSFMELKDGKCLLALSDGMGSGTKAGQESAASIELLEKFVEAGFSQEIAIKMINSALVLKEGSESFATLDICLVDLHSGFAEFAKVGAAETYLIRNNEVSIIRSKSLPVGILTEVDIETSTKKLLGGDILVMITDGISDSKGTNELWIPEILKSFCSNNPQDIADNLLFEAKKNYGSHIKDDMTVLAARFWEKY